MAGSKDDGIGLVEFDPTVEEGPSPPPAIMEASDGGPASMGLKLGNGTDCGCDCK